jgi:hypothetical protein
MHGLRIQFILLVIGTANDVVIHHLIVLESVSRISFIFEELLLSYLSMYSTHDIKHII